MTFQTPRKREQPPPGQVALWLAIGGVLATFIGTVGSLIGLGLLIAALVMGIRARREAKRTGTPARGAVPAIVIGAVSLFFMVIGLVGLAIFSEEFLAYQECSQGANTEVARDACMNELMDSVRQRLDR